MTAQQAGVQSSHVYTELPGSGTQIFSAPQLGTSIETPHSTITVPVVRLILCLRRAGAEISPTPDQRGPRVRELGGGGHTGHK